MIKKSFLLGAIASVIAINSVFADTIVTSKSYVDNRDALKQDKITAGTTGNVVTYNGTQNGQAQFSERAIFDPDTNFDYENNEVATGHEGDLLDAGSIFPGLVGMGNDVSRMRKDLNEMNSALQGTAGNVITYNENGYAGGERGICDAAADENGDCDDDNLVTRDLLSDQINFLGDQIILPRTTTTNKVCTEWVSGQSHTDANCLLWNLIDQTVYGCLADGASCTSPGQCCGGYCDGGVCASPQY